MLDVNLTGAFLRAQEAAREMNRAKGGVILNIASAYAVVAAPNRTAYCATKAAVAMLSKVLVSNRVGAGRPARKCHCSRLNEAATRSREQ